MKKRLISALIISLLISSQVCAIEDVHTKLHCDCEQHEHNKKNVVVTKGSMLNVLDCISIGLENSPIIKEYAYKLEIAKSNVGVAKSAYFPELSVGAGYYRSVNSNRTELSRDYWELPSVGVSLNKMIWDFGRTTANIRMQDFLKIAASYEFEDVVCSTVFDIKTHYYNLLRANSLFDAQRTILELQQNIIKDMKKLGKPKSDILTAEVELLKLKSDYLKAEDEVKNAQEALNNAMFFENAPQYTIYETQSFEYKPTKQTVFKDIFYKNATKTAKDNTIFQHPKYSYDKAVELAYKNSPDVKALVATKDAMEQALISVKRNYYPELNAGVGYDFLRSKDLKNNGLSVAVGLDASINGMRQKYDVKGAKAQLDLADTEIITFKKNLYFTVRKRLNTVEMAYENIPITEKQMQTATENFNQTYDNYKTGKMNQLELENAIRLYRSGLKSYIDAKYEYNIALINLEMSMHEHLIDYHDDAEHAVEYHHGDENNILGKLIRCGKKHKK